MFYRIIWCILQVYFFVFYRLIINGKNNIPGTGSLIVCSNHASLLDPVVLAMITKRRIYYMAKKELFDIKLLRIIIENLGAFPVDRQATDIKAYKKVIELLEEGCIVGIFAQGGRADEQMVKNARAGAALFALKTSAQIIPVAINSSYKFFSKITINIGPALNISGYRNKKIKTENLNKITDEIINKINELLKGK